MTILNDKSLLKKNPNIIERNRELLSTVSSNNIYLATISHLHQIFVIHACGIFGL